MGLLLVVEYDNNQRLLLQEALEEEGYTVLSAANAEDALDSVRMTMPDLVVSAVQMPGMDGLELLGKLLAINSRLPVVIHTAYGCYKDSFMSWSADAYVLKQSDLSELKDSIRGILTAHGASSASDAVAELQLA